MSSFFAFLASSSFVYIDHFGLSPFVYGFAFSRQFGNTHQPVTGLELREKRAGGHVQHLLSLFIHQQA